MPAAELEPCVVGMTNVSAREDARADRDHEGRVVLAALRVPGGTFA